MNKLRITGYKKEEFDKMQQEHPEMSWREIKWELSGSEFLGFVYVDENNNVVLDIENPEVKKDLSKLINNQSKFGIKRRERKRDEQGEVVMMRTLIFEQRPGDPYFLDAIEESWHHYQKEEFGGYIISVGVVDEHGNYIDRLLSLEELKKR